MPDRIAVLCRGKIPVERFVKIFGDALTVLVEGSEIIFRGRVMDARGGFVILEGERVVFGNKLAVFVKIAEIEFGVGIILRDGIAKVVEGGGNIVGRRIVSEHEFCETILGSGVATIGESPQSGSGLLLVWLRRWRLCRGVPGQ